MLVRWKTQCFEQEGTVSKFILQRLLCGKYIIRGTLKSEKPLRHDGVLDKGGSLSPECCFMKVKSEYFITFWFLLFLFAAFFISDTSAALGSTCLECLMNKLRMCIKLTKKQSFNG